MGANAVLDVGFQATEDRGLMSLAGEKTYTNGACHHYCFEFVQWSLEVGCRTGSADKVSSDWCSSMTA